MIGDYWVGNHTLGIWLYRVVASDGKTRDGQLVLALDGHWIVLLFFTNGKFKVSLHAINHCCDVGFLNTR